MAIPQDLGNQLVEEVVEAKAEKQALLMEAVEDNKRTLEENLCFMEEGLVALRQGMKFRQDFGDLLCEVLNRNRIF